MVKVRVNGASSSAGGTAETAVKLIPSTGRILYAAAGRHKLEIEDCTIVRLDKVPPCDVEWDLNNGLPFKDNEFDGVLSIETLEHLENIRMFIREVVRVANEWAVVTFPNILSEHGRKWYETQNYRKGHISVPHFPLLQPYINELKWSVDAQEYNSDKEEIFIFRMINKKPTKRSGEVELHL